MHYEIHPTEKAVEVLPKDSCIVIERDNLLLVCERLKLSIDEIEKELKRLGVYGEYTVAKFTPVRYKKDVPYDQVR